jgi:hypothetical protein
MLSGQLLVSAHRQAKRNHICTVLLWRLGSWTCCRDEGLTTDSAWSIMALLCLPCTPSTETLSLCTGSFGQGAGCHRLRLEGCTHVGGELFELLTDGGPCLAAARVPLTACDPLVLQPLAPEQVSRGLLLEHLLRRAMLLSIRIFWPIM